MLMLQQLYSFPFFLVFKIRFFNNRVYNALLFSLQLDFLSVPLFGCHRLSEEITFFTFQMSSFVRNGLKKNMPKKTVLKLLAGYTFLFRELYSPTPFRKIFDIQCLGKTAVCMFMSYPCSWYHSVIAAHTFSVLFVYFISC